MAKLRLSLACWNCDRTRGLMEGRIPVDGVEHYDVVEREYYAKTKIFPIMHTVVIRREVYSERPWVVQSLYKAFVAAKPTATSRKPRR